MKRTWKGLGVLLAVLAAACSDSATNPMGPSVVAPPVRTFDGTGGGLTVSGATIVTDKSDYAPGEVVTMTGSGWLPGETVTLFMTEDPVADGPHTWELVANGEGQILYMGFSPGTQHLGVTFTLVATGQTSGLTATTLFTDGTISSVDLFAVRQSDCATALAGSVAPGTPLCAAFDLTTTSGNTNFYILWRNVGAATYAEHDFSVGGGAHSLTDAYTPLVAGTWQVVLCSANPSPDCPGPQTRATASFTVLAPPSNTAPIVNAGSDATIDEGGTFSQNGSFTDPDANTWTATVDYGEGAGAGALALVGKTFSLSHVYAQDGVYTVTVCVADGVGGSHCDTVQVTVNNVAPVVDAGADDTILEGGTFTGSGSFTDPGVNDPWSATVDYGDGSGTSALALSGMTFGLSHVYGDDGMYTLEVCVYDDLEYGCDTLQVTVNNVAPVVDAGADDTIDEGDTFSRSVTFVDPGTDTWTATVDYGDGGGSNGLGPVTSPFPLSHTYTDDGLFTVTVCVTDDDGGSDCDDAVITVNNVAPAVDAGLDATINEGDTFSRSVTFEDPGDDQWTATVNYGDGGGVMNLGLVGKSFPISHQYGDNGIFTVTVCVADDDGGSDCDDASVTVNNVAPTITSMSVSTNGPISVTAMINVTGTFSDPGFLDTHTLTLDCNGGSASNQSAVLPNASGKCTYANAGVYKITATVSDDDGGSDTWMSDYIVVYDPSAGFVTGGGWIESPSNACLLTTACEGLTGKANFGFVSKYLKGANVPTGDTEFQFKAGDLNFKSTSYEWLVVSGARAQYKGVGKINGTAGFGFILTAVDGDLNGGGGTDKFRIKIWRISDSTIVYDNQIGADDNTAPSTAISGGSIVIHAPKK